jgi:hypothetical protein
MSNGKDTTFFDQLMQGPSFDVKKKDEEEEEKSFFDQLMSGPSFEPEPLVSYEEIAASFRTQASTTDVDIKTPGVQRVDEGGMPKISSEVIEHINKNPMTDDESLLYNIYSSVRDWYSERGGISPEDKLSIMNMEETRLQEEVEKGELSEEDRNAHIKGLVDYLGVKRKEDGTFEAFEHEKEQYNALLLEEYQKHLQKKKDEEKDPFMKDVWDKLNIGSAQVLNSFDNIMAIMEKGGNAIMGKESEYWKQSAQYKNELLEKQREANNRYDMTIEEAIKSGDTGAAVGQTVLSVAENLPLLMALVAGNVAGYSKATLGFMGTHKAAEEYMKVDDDPDMKEFTKIVNSVGKGLSEIIWEGTGTMTILNNVRRSMSKRGTDVVRQQMVDAVTPMIQRRLGGLMRGMSPMVREGASEWATEVTDNIMDKASGKEVGIFDNATDAAIVGGVIGLGLGSPMMRGTKKNEAVKRVIDVLPDWNSSTAFESKAKLVPLIFQDERLAQMMENAPEGMKRSLEQQQNEVNDQIAAIVAKEEGFEPETEMEPTTIERARVGDQIIKEKEYTNLDEVREDIGTLQEERKAIV